MAQDYVVTGGEMAGIFGVSGSTLANWRRAGMPCVDPGRRGSPARYNAPACIHWYVSRQCGQNEALELNLERARLAHHQANKVAIEESLLKGEVVKTLDVIETWIALVGAARAKLLSLPSKMAARLHGDLSIDEKKVALEAEIRGALSELSGQGLPRKIAALLEAGGAGVAAATKTVRQ